MKVTITPARHPVPFDSAAVGSWWQDRQGNVYRVVRGDDTFGLVCFGGPGRLPDDFGRLYTGRLHPTISGALGASMRPEDLTPFRGTITVEAP